MKILVPLLLIIACGCPQKTGTEAPQPTPSQPAEPAPAQPSPAPAQPTPAPTDPATPPANPTQGTGSAATEPAPNWPKGGGPGIGENCGANDACAKGLTCVSYYGIAGARGPQFKTCEIKCTADSACPAGHKCVTVADGPGQVCRK